ncbi:MAG: hypothetical protein WA814_10010 [Candidatus Baltobacteraceae bacterium]
MRLQRLLISAAVVAAVALPAAAFAQVETTPIPAASKPNFSSMSFLVGSWTCHTKSARRPAAYVTNVTYSMDPSGYWMDQTSVTNPTAWVTTKLTINDKITYDGDTKRWVDVSYGDQGAYGLSFSSGWVGNELTWHDMSFAPGPDIKSQTPTTITKVSDTKMTSTSSFTEKSGRKVGVTGVCTKS